MALANDNSLGSTPLPHPQNAENQKYVGGCTNDYHRDISSDCLEQTKSVLNSLKSLKNLASSQIYSEEKEARLGGEMIRKNGKGEKEEKDKNIRKKSRKVEKGWTGKPPSCMWSLIHVEPLHGRPTPRNLEQEIHSLLK